MKNSKKIAALTKAALVGALYVILALVPPLNLLAFGPIQFRVSESFMLLCLLSGRCVPGVIIGCFLANLFTPYGANVFDLTLGTFATLLAACVTYLLRGFFSKNKFTILLSPLPTVLSNSLIVGSYLPYITGGNLNLISVLYCMLTIALGEIAVLYILGIPLFYFFKNKNILE